MTPYPNRHEELSNLCLYVFTSRFENIPVSRIPSKTKTLNAIYTNSGVSPNVKYYVFTEEYSGIEE